MYDKRLDTFLEVCNTQSFNTASERLYISPSAIKKQIDLLERELGFKLFKRSKKGVSLTLSGQSFYKDTLKLIKLSNDAQRRAFLIAQKERYTIKVGSSLLFSSNELLKAWSKIAFRYPKFEIDVVPFEDDYNGPYSIIENISKRFDLMVGACASLNWYNKLEFLNLLDLDFYLSIPLCHPLSKKEKLKLIDLRGERIMLVKKGDSEVIDKIRVYLKERYPEIEIVDTNFYYDIDTFNYCEHHAITLLSLKIWENIHPLFKTLKIDLPFKMPYGLLYDKNAPDGVKEFVDIMKTAFNSEHVL